MESENINSNSTKNDKNNKPLISVIVPIYNGEKHIENCAKSILNQDYENVELIFINDGSSDNSDKILKNLAEKDGRIQVIYQANRGVSTARNRGIEVAKGEFLTFVDVDDLISNDFVSYYYGLIEKYNAEIALTPMPMKFDNNSKNIVENINDYIEIWDGEKTTCEMLYYNIAIGPWNKLISKKLIDEYHIRFNSKLAYGEGFNFSVDCFQRAKSIAVGKRKVYYYRVDNPNSVMTTFKLELVTGSIEAQKNIKNNLVVKTDKVLKACKYANWHTYCDCLNTMIGCKVVKQNKKIYLDIKKVCRKDANCALNAPVSKSDKIKGVLYSISPYFAAKFINKFRKRKFTVKDSESTS